MNWVTDFVQNTFDFIYKIFSFFLYPYYEKEYFSEKKTFKEYVRHTVGYFAIWLVIGLVYCVVFYVFIIKAEDKNVFDQLGDFGKRPLLDIFHDVYLKIYESIWANSFFLYIFYKSVTSYAQKEFLNDHFVHHKSSGLIKVIKIGSFDSQSTYKEQASDKVEIGRAHFYNLVKDEKHENITIVSASGWDLFGNPPPMLASEKEIPQSEPVKKPGRLKRCWRKAWFIFSKFIEFKDLSNGYLLKFLGMRNKHFNILILDPGSEAATERAGTYLKENSHKVIDNIQSYSDNINIVLRNIANSSRNNSHVRVKLMKCIPTWKIVKVDKEVWVQPIISGARSDHTMLYGYKNSSYSKYHIYFNKIEDLWNNSGPEIDLSKYRT